jgi:hypothetical protein
MTLATPRIATPSRTRVGRFNDQAVAVAAILKASGHEPSSVVFDTLRLIHQRNQSLSFRDFVGGCALALTMAEASERGLQS